jgi:ketosteroid isomerase-like protein
MLGRMRPNADIVRGGYEHFAATGDMHPEIVAPDFIWDMSHYIGWPEDQTYEGVDGARTFLRLWAGSWDDWEVEVQSLHEAGDQVLAMMHQSGRSKEAGLPLEMTFAMLWTLRDGMEIRMEMYSDPAEATRAFGLQAHGSP